MSFNDRSVDIQGDGGKISIQPDGMVRFGSDSNINVLFYKKEVYDEALSQQYGRPMKKGVDYVRIQHAGERDYSDDPLVNKPGIEARFPHQWQQYLKSREQAPPGTPTEILFPTNPEIPANLHGAGVHTVEQLAELSETAAQNIGMGVTQWRNQARDFLTKANAHVGIHQWNKEKSEMTSKIEVMENQIALQKAQIDRLLAQLQQGVPAAMIPTGVPPQAQAHAATVSATPRPDWTAQYSHPNLGLNGQTEAMGPILRDDNGHRHGYAAPTQPVSNLPPVAAQGVYEGGASFSPAGQVQSSGAQISPTPPQALGRPRGRPRKTPIPTAEGTK